MPKNRALKIAFAVLFLCSFAVGMNADPSDCRAQLVEGSPEVILRKLVDSNLAKPYHQVTSAHHITGHLLATIRPYLTTFYGYAELPADEWDLSIVNQVDALIHTWLPESAKNRPENIGRDPSTSYAAELMRRLGLTERTLEQWLPPMPNVQSAFATSWREERKRGQVAMLDSFFWPDHGIEHIKDMLARSFDLPSVIPPGFEERYAFLLDQGNEGTLWRVRLREAILLHDITATTYRKQHPYLACGTAHQIVGEMSLNNYVPILNQPRGSFQNECKIVGTLALLSSKSVIPTDALPNFRSILQEQIATNHLQMFRVKRPDESPFFSISEMALATVQLPPLDQDHKMIRAAEIIRLLGTLRKKGVTSRVNPDGLVNSAGYPFQINSGDSVLVSITDFSHRPIAIAAPDSVQFALYGQLALGTPDMQIGEKGETKLVFPVLHRTHELPVTLRKITETPEFRALLGQSTYQKSDLVALSDDEKVQSVLNAILDVAFEFPLIIRKDIYFAFPLSLSSQ